MVTRFLLCGVSAFLVDHKFQEQAAAIGKLPDLHQVMCSAVNIL